jgi:hypothetical protein
MFRFRWLPRLVALLALVVALFATAASASAATGTIQLGTGKLLARGAAVDVPVTVSLTCDDSFTSADVQLYLSQGEGRSVASGGGSAQVPCSSEPQTLTIRVFANGTPFRGGSAVANAYAYQCRVEEGWGLVCYIDPTVTSTSQVILLTGA